MNPQYYEWILNVNVEIICETIECKLQNKKTVHLYYVLKYPFDICTNTVTSLILYFNGSLSLLYKYLKATTTTKTEITASSKIFLKV